MFQMSRSKYYIKSKLTNNPWRYFLSKAFGKVNRRTNRKRDLSESTFSMAVQDYPSSISSYLRELTAGSLRPYKKDIYALAQKSINHEFDLLGSGPTRVHHGMDCSGIEGIKYENTITEDHRSWNNCAPANRELAKKIANHIVEPYIPIDWHVDFKSGYRWSEACWHKDIKYGHIPGADVKVPWELARMQHLPMLAWAYGCSIPAKDSLLSEQGKGALQDPYLREFQNQVIDFIAANPPRFGVNWRCSMDVAIRVANWLLAFDIFRSFGAAFDNTFQEIFVSSVYDHVLHIASNLEYSPFLQGNHYLADLVGVLIATAYLESSDDMDFLLAFTIEEVNRQVLKQFFPDGSNFEASTSYHGLSLEMAIFALAYILALPESRISSIARFQRPLSRIARHEKSPPHPLNKTTPHENSRILSKTVIDRVIAACGFSRSTTDNNGRNLLIGDNDSGGFFKLFPFYKIPGNSADHQAQAYEPEVVSLARGLFEKSPLEGTSLLSWFIGSLVKVPIDMDFDNRVFHGIRSSENSGARLRSFPDFGLYIYSTENYDSSVRCGNIGQNGRGGHAHNDQLSITLSMANTPILIDPGLFVYTSIPEYRNKFRSTHMHNTLAVADLEQNPWPNGPGGMFRLKNRSKSELILAEPGRFAGKHHGFSQPHRRSIYFETSEILIEDVCQYQGVKSINLIFHPDVSVRHGADQAEIVAQTRAGTIRFLSDNEAWTIKESVCAPEYGRLKKTLQTTLITISHRIIWRIVF